MPVSPETSRRKQTIAERASDVERWSDPRNLEAAWQARSARAADYIRAGAKVVDIGCGAMALEGLLPLGCSYAPCDIVARDDRTRVCDLNRGELPRADLGKCSVVTMLGVLEYLYEPAALLSEIARSGSELVLTYCCAEDTAHLDRGALGWVNAHSRAEVSMILAKAGFDIHRIDRVDGLQHLWQLRPAAQQPVQPDSTSSWAPRVLVVSYANVGNFGDRLGWHLIHQVLPPGAVVTHTFHHPWNPPAGEFDLLVLGIGNSLFQPMFASDELLALVDRIPRRIGIFGTQYRHAIDRTRMNALMSRLDTWYARHAEDISWGGERANRVVHLGDWLVDAFPMAVPSDGRTLKIGDQIWKNLPLDRTIQKIQTFRRVHSARLHPLLCALTSAEQVSYSEQPDAQGRPSGKFRSMLLDIFGRNLPPDVPWPVERERVTAYKEQVRARMEVLRADLAMPPR